MRQVAVVDLRVFGVHVEDGIAQNADGGDGIDALPEHVAGIVVAADGVAGDRAQPQHGFRAVDDEAGMHLDGDLHAVILGELARVRSSRASPSCPTAIPELPDTRAARGR